MAIIKRIGIYAGIAIAIYAGGYVTAYFTRANKPIVVDPQGEIVEKTNITKPANVSNTGCSPMYIAWCDGLYSDFNAFLGSVPEVYNVTQEKIYFKIHTQKYALSYSSKVEAHWWFAPCVKAQFSFKEGINYGGGVLGGYGDIGGGIIFDSSIAISALIFYRFEIK